MRPSESCYSFYKGSDFKATERGSMAIAKRSGLKGHPWRVEQ